MGRYLVNKQIPCCRASARQCTTDAVETRFDQKSGTRGAASVLRMFLPHFYVFCYLLLYRPTATMNLFVLCNKKTKCC